MDVLSGPLFGVPHPTRLLQMMDALLISDPHLAAGKANCYLLSRV